MIILTKKNIKKTIIYIGIASIVLALFLCVDMNKKDATVTSANTSESVYEILVDVEESVLYLMQDKQIVKTYSCSGGKWSTPSPIGTWTITGKDTWGEGFRRKVDGIKCSMGKVWNTWNIRPIFSWMGKLARMYKNE